MGRNREGTRLHGTYLLSYRNKDWWDDVTHERNVPSWLKSSGYHKDYYYFDFYKTKAASISSKLLVCFLLCFFCENRMIWMLPFWITGTLKKGVPENLSVFPNIQGTWRGNKPHFSQLLIPYNKCLFMCGWESYLKPQMNRSTIHYCFYSCI